MTRNDAMEFDVPDDVLAALDYGRWVEILPVFCTREDHRAARECAVVTVDQSSGLDCSVTSLWYSEGPHFEPTLLDRHWRDGEE